MSVRSLGTAFVGRTQLQLVGFRIRSMEEFKVAVGG